MEQEASQVTVIDNNGNEDDRTNQEISSESKPLSEKEKNLLVDLEKKFYQSLYDAAFALKEIRDKKLYRESYVRFEDYCIEKLEISRRYVHYQINFATILEEFEKEQVVPLPTKEYQVRPLAKLKPEERLKIWLESSKDEKIPKPRVLQDAINKNKLKKQKYTAIEKKACVLIIGASKEAYKDYVGYWGFVESVSKRDTYTVKLPQKTIKSVPRGDLREITLEDDLLQLRTDLFDRLKNIYQSNNSFEPMVMRLLQDFGKNKESNLTNFENELIDLILKHSQVT